jgi:hypothetical protein
VDVVGRHTHGEHKACIKILPNQGRVNWVFECASVLYGPRLEPNSEASEEAAMKRKQDADAGFLVKCMNVSGRKAASARTIGGHSI